MATSTTPSDADENDDEPREFRLRSTVEIPFKGSSPSPAKIRALLTPMAIEEIEPGKYRVLVDGDEYRTNIDTRECSCTDGAHIEGYKCKHYFHVRLRRDSGTVDAPDREDPVKKQARESKPVAEAAREYEKKIDRAGGVVAGPDQSLVQCVHCDEHSVIPEMERVDPSVYVCPGCPPVDDSIVYLDGVREASEGTLVAVRDVVAGESARSYYPGDESVFSLADMFSDIAGVTNTDSVVLVSKPAESAEIEGMVFSVETQAVPQGALRSVEGVEF